MKFCYNTPTEYMSIKDEKIYSLRVLKIAITSV